MSLQVTVGRGSGQRAERLWAVDALVPLAPTLSPGERENVSLGFGDGEAARPFEGCDSFDGGIRGPLSPRETEKRSQSPANSTHCEPCEIRPAINIDSDPKNFGR